MIYITGTTASRWRGGESTGNLLCLNGSHAETSHIVIKKDTMVLVFAFSFFCHNVIPAIINKCQNNGFVVLKLTLREAPSDWCVNHIV